MKGDSYQITVAEGGFIVDVHRLFEATEATSLSSTRVFADSSALLNYLHNELVGSN